MSRAGIVRAREPVEHRPVRDWPPEVVPDLLAPWFNRVTVPQVDSNRENAHNRLPIGFWKLQKPPPWQLIVPEDTREGQEARDHFRLRIEGQRLDLFH